tara:strand:- start:2386 stop:2631 length:246 start_codon:yes stop_codon:yes gene_type:complete
MPKTKPGAVRVNITMPVFNDESIDLACEVTKAHSEHQDSADMTSRAWTPRGDEGTGSRFVVGNPIAKSRWTKDGSISVEVL